MYILCSIIGKKVPLNVTFPKANFFHILITDGRNPQIVAREAQINEPFYAESERKKNYEKNPIFH